MNIFIADRIMNRLNIMIDNAITGNPVESGFDETKMSALETKLSHYLAMNSATQKQFKEEKMRVSELISDISHQTKTPIANILLYSQLLAEGELHETESDLLKSLISQAEKLNFLIASLLKTSRLESGLITLLPKENPIQPLIDAILIQGRPKAEYKNITLKSKPTQTKAIFDMKWTTEALNNILDNAIKYTPNEGTVSISVTAYQLFCRVDIVDTGIGISERDIAKIFSRFYRSSEVSEKEGVGIGLYLAREIVTSEGGYIKVKSEPQKGSLFSVFLPMKS